jgi:uncharacterized protein (TIGR02271 family)
MADIRIGSVVYSADGEKLGKLVRAEGDLLVIEKGFFFPEDFAARRADVASASEGEVRLRLTRAQLEDAGQSPAATPRGGVGREEMGGATFGETKPGVSGREMEAVRVPVVEEQLEVEKRTRQAGSVRITKQVREEQKQVTVPVRKEEVRVERVPATGASAGDTAIGGGRIDVPVMEEEVVVSKRPVVKEEVRISKQVKEEPRRVAETVRREEVDVEDDRDESEGARPFGDAASPQDR